jgi:arginine repressor
MRREEIEARLRKYLERDKKGVRKELLKLLLQGKKYTTEEIYKELNHRGVQLNIRGVSAMVGLMSARLGIIKMELGEKNKYFLKPEYAELVESILKEYESGE